MCLNQEEKKTYRKMDQTQTKHQKIHNLLFLNNRAFSFYNHRNEAVLGLVSCARNRATKPGAKGSGLD